MARSKRSQRRVFRFRRLRLEQLENRSLLTTAAHSTSDTVGSGDFKIQAAAAVGIDETIAQTKYSYTVRNKDNEVLTETSLADFWNSALGQDGRVNEVQELTWSGPLVTPPIRYDDLSFVISYGPLLSEPITYSHSDPALLQNRIQTGLDQMFGAGNTRVLMMSDTTDFPQHVDVVFCGQLAGMHMQPLELRWAGPNITATQSSPKIGIGGSFTLSFAMPTGTVTTTPIAWNGGFSGIQSALDTALGAGTAKVLSTHIEFADPELKAHPPTMTIDDSNLTGGHLTASLDESTESDEVQSLIFSGQPTGGTFSLSIADYRDQLANWSPPFDIPVITTPPIVFSSDASQTAANIQSALTAANILGQDNAVVTAISPYQFDIRFDGLFPGDRWYYDDPKPFLTIPVRLTADASGLTGESAPAITASDPIEANLQSFGTVVVSPGAGNEVQRLSIDGSAPSGVLTLVYGPGMTIGVPWTDDRATFVRSLQSSLDQIFGSGNTTVFEVADGEFDIGFSGQLASVPLSPLHVLGTPDGITAKISELDRGSGNELQRLTFTGDVADSSLTLSYGPALTATIQGSSDTIVLASRVEDALAQMFGPGSVRVLPAGVTPNQFDIIFGGPLAATKMMPLTVTSDQNDGAQIDEIAAGVGNTVQRLKISAPPVGQSLKFALPHFPVIDVPWNSDSVQLAGSLQTALDNALGAGNSRVFLTADHQFDVVFCGEFSGLDLPPLAVIGTTQTQRISFQFNIQGGGITSGTFTLGIPPNNFAVTTAPIPYKGWNQTTADAIATALKTILPDPGLVITCQPADYGFSITFTGDQAASVPLLGIDASKLSLPVGDVVIASTADPSSGPITVAVLADGKGATATWLQIPDGTPEGFNFNIGLPAELRAQHYPNVPPTANPFYRTIAYTSDKSVFKSRVESALNDLLGPGAVTVFDGPYLLVVYSGPFANTHLPGPHAYFGDSLGGTWSYFNPAVTSADFNLISPTNPQITFDPQSGHWFAISTISPQQESLLTSWHEVQHSLIGVAVSNTSNPLDGWKAVEIDPDQYRLRDSDITSLVIDSDSINITVRETDKFDGLTPAVPSGVTKISLPKSDLIGGNPTAAHAVVSPVTPGFLPAPPGNLFSATLPDPVDPYDSWTFQEYIPAGDAWALNVHKDSTAPADRPVTLADSYQTKQGTLLSIAPDIGLLSNDQKIQPGNSTVSLQQIPSHGTLQLNADGSFIYTPSDGFSGLDSFTYFATSGGVLSKSATVTINVLRINAPPSFVAGGDVDVAAESGPQAIDWAKHVSPGRATEFDQQVHFLVTSSNPALFSQQPQIDATGKLTFIPKSNTGGSADVTVSLIDNGGTANGGTDSSPTQTFTIQIDVMLPWHNPEMPTDVTGDGNIVAQDAVDVINYINARGSGPVTVIGQSTLMVQSAPGDTNYYDVTGDDYVAADDVIAIINYINAHPTNNSGPTMAEGEAPTMNDDALMLVLATDAAQQITGRKPR